MQELTLDILAHRLNRIEREVRRWRLGATIVLTCILAVLVMGQTLPKPKIIDEQTIEAQTIEAKRFVLRLSDGRVGAILGPHYLNQNAPPARRPWGPINEFGSTWGLHIFGPDGGSRAHLATWPSENEPGHLHLADKNTKSSASLGVGPGYASLDLSATTQSHEEWERQISEAIKKDRAAQTPKEKAEVLALFPSPERRAGLLVFKDQTALTLSEKDGAEVVLGRVALQKLHGVVEQRPLSSVVFFDKSRTVLWKAP